jgi:hypothetical protein
MWIARAGRLMAKAAVDALLVAAPRTRRAVCMFSPRGSARRRRWAISA